MLAPGNKKENSFGGNMLNERIMVNISLGICPIGKTCNGKPQPIVNCLICWEKNEMKNEKEKNND